MDYSVKTYDRNTRLIDLNLGQLEDFIKDVICENIPKSDSPKRTLAHSYKEFAELMGISVSTVHKIKKSGIIDGAICQFRRNVEFDVDEARRLIIKSKQKLVSK